MALVVVHGPVMDRNVGLLVPTLEIVAYDLVVLSCLFGDMASENSMPVSVGGHNAR